MSANVLALALLFFGKANLSWKKKAKKKKKKRKNKPNYKSL